MKTPFGDLDTNDVLILMFASVVVLVLVGVTIGLVVIALIPPEEDISAAGAWVADTVDLLIGILIGIIAGRFSVQKG